MYGHFIRAINKQAQKTSIEMTPISMDESKPIQTCKEINSASTMNEAIKIATTCLAGMGSITGPAVISVIVGKLADIAITIIRTGSEAKNWKDWFEFLCAFLREILSALTSIGVMNQVLANESLVATIADLLIGKLGGWLLSNSFWRAQEAILNSPQMKQFLKDLIIGGPKNIEAFCRQVSQWTNAELDTLVQTISDDAQKVAAMLSTARQFLQTHLGSSNVRALLILALLAAIGITAASGGFSAPITAPTAALIIMIFVMCGQDPPTMQEIEGAWRSA
jgi:hypothetical protein